MASKRKKNYSGKPLRTLLNNLRGVGRLGEGRTLIWLWSPLGAVARRVPRTGRVLMPLLGLLPALMPYSLI